MPRLQLQLPDSFPFATELRVRISDLNYGGHLGHDRMLALLHEARVRMLRHHGMSEADCGGCRLVIADAAVVFRAEAFAGDALTVEVALGVAERVSCDFFYRVTRIADGARIAEARTALVFLDPATRRPAPVPDAVRRLAAGPGQHG
jgi:acyl-CoA thioester hydrolase